MNSKVYTIKRDIFFDKNPEGIFILSPLGETLILDDDVSMLIWHELSINIELNTSSLVEKLLQDFQLESSLRKNVENDVKRFFTELLKYELVEDAHHELQEPVY